MKFIFALIGLIFFYLGYSAINSKVSPVSYHPLKSPLMKGIFAKNKILKNSKHIALGKYKGPEDIAIDDKGRIYGGTHDGKILQIEIKNNIKVIKEFANTEGRPLGLEFDLIGNLIVADSYKGLLSISKDKKITTLTTSVNKRPFKFTDDLDIGPNGIIYFSDASSKYSQEEYLLDMIESQPYGRLLSYNPKNKITKVLLNNLYFANGVAVSKKGDFILVNETYRYRVIRYWLEGEKAGKKEIFLNNLPGFPDGISSDSDGNFWLALFTVRNKIMDSIHPFPIIKKIFALLPKFLWPGPRPYGLVLKISPEGKILKSYQDPSGKNVKEITSVVKNKNNLYFGTLRDSRISWIPIK